MSRPALPTGKVLAALGLLLCAPRVQRLAAQPAARPGAGWVVDLNPTVVRSANPADSTQPLFGGRVNALAVDPKGARTVYAASESGGVFVSSDGGTTWSHVDEIAMAATNDVKYMPGRRDVIVATGNYDGRVRSRGGVWISRSGGRDWEAVDVGAGCTQTPSARRIAFGSAAGNRPATIYVADDCGIAASDNLGATWRHLTPDGQPSPYSDVVATSVHGSVQLDTCGDHGYFRSGDGGQRWTPPDPGTPYLSTRGTARCRLAVSPSDPNTVYLTGDSMAATLVETTSTVVPRTWSFVGRVDCGGQARGDFVQTRPAFDGDPGRFEVYYSSGVRLLHQTCSTAQTPRCRANVAGVSETWDWFDRSISLYHPDPILLAGCGGGSDPGELAFDPSRPNGCPILEAGDPGIARTANGCDAEPKFEPSNVGLDALWVFGFPTELLESGFSGTVSPDHTDLYMGMQDEGLKGSRDGGATWFSTTNEGSATGGDVIHVLAGHSGPGSRVLYSRSLLSSISLEGSDDELRSLSSVPPLASLPPDVCTHGDYRLCWPEYTAIGPGAYAFLGGAFGDPSSDPSDLIVTADGGQTYARVGPVPLPGPFGYLPQASGPVSAPTFYYLAFDENINPGLYQVKGPSNGEATVTRAGGLVTPHVYAVSSADPDFLYVSDVGARKMLWSRDGGRSWTPDQDLTDRITHHGEFRFAAPFPNTDPSGVNTVPVGQVTAIGFDPSGRTILVGTWSAGIFASFDAGAHWREVPGGEQIPRAAGFFFNESTGAIYVGSTGRGVWRIDVPGREVGTRPHITEFFPTSGPPGTPVTITGRGLDQVTEVAFNGVPSTPVHNPDGSLTAVVPAGNEESGPITVATPIFFDVTARPFLVSGT